MILQGRGMMSRDIISSLPDDILVHIISSLETQYAIRTGILSKRWNSIWMKSTSIVLDENDFEAALTRGDMVRSHNGDVIEEDSLYYDQEIRQRYVSAVNGVLLSHIGPVMIDFIISFRGRLGGEQEYLNRWIRHLTTVKKVENLSITFPKCPELPPYHLSFSLFSCDSIILLILSGCSIQSVTSCRTFTSIETLVLQDCSVSHDSVSSIFTNFPSLRTCTMEDICMGSNLSFSAPWLKVLRIMQPVVSTSYLEIDAPSLEYLYICYVEDRHLKIRMRNMQSLITLKLLTPFTGSDNFCGENLVEFRQVKHLTIDLGYLVTMGIWMAQNQEKVLVNLLASLEYLNINDFGLSRMGVNALVSLLQVTPKLQKLIINDLLPVEDQIEDCVDPSFEGLKNLKQIRVTRVDSGSIGRIFLRFFEFLFKYAVSLETLEIEFLDMDESEDMDESSKLAFEKELLALPRTGAPQIHFS